jgi:hypothetical protein
MIIKDCPHFIKIIEAIAIVSEESSNEVEN